MIASLSDHKIIEILGTFHTIHFKIKKLPWDKYFRNYKDVGVVMRNIYTKEKRKTKCVVPERIWKLQL